MKPAQAMENDTNAQRMRGNVKRRIGSLEGQDLIAADYDIDECNGEIAEMFGVSV